MALLKKSKKANIMLLVLFVMFVSSLLGLLVSQYIRNMIAISGLYKEYYSTYYYAYAWLELGLAQVKYRESNSQKPFGFEDQVSFNQFSECAGTCAFEMTISSRSQIITDSYNPLVTNCSGSNAMGEVNPLIREDIYRIDPGDAFIVPLFYDISTGFNDVVYDTIDYVDGAEDEFDDLNPELYTDYAVWWTYSEEYIVRLSDDKTYNYLVSIEPTIDAANPLALDAEPDLAYSWDITNKNYLIVANATGTVKDFCLQLSPEADATHTELPTKYITITSVAVLNNATVAFGAIKNNDLPSFIIYGTISTE